MTGRFVSETMKGLAMTEKTYTLTARQLDLVIQCIARAETEGAFKDCVLPRIGRRVLAMLEAKRAEPEPTACREYDWRNG
jgi:hypothetical protein